MKIKKIILLSLIPFINTSCFQDGNGCDGDVNAKNGINIKYYDHKPIWIYQLHNCNLNGININFHTNGKIERFGYGNMGKEEGEWLLYDTSGALLTKHFYEKGKLYKVTDHTNSIVFDRRSFILNFGSNSLDLSKDSLIINSHYSDFTIRNLQNDTLIFNSERKNLVLDSHLNIISSSNK